MGEMDSLSPVAPFRVLSHVPAPDDQVALHLRLDGVVVEPAVIAAGYTELCDGWDTRGVQCWDLGYIDGWLQCMPDCMSYDTTWCTTGPPWLS